MRWGNIIMFILCFAGSAWSFRKSGLCIWDVFEERREGRTIFLSNMIFAMVFMVMGIFLCALANSFRIG